SPILRKELGKSFSGREWFHALLSRGRNFLKKAAEIARKHGGRLVRPPDYASYDELRQEISRSFPHLALRSCKEAIVQQVATDLANTFGAERLRDILSGVDQRVAEQILAYVTPETPGAVTEDLKKLYGRIRFEEYELNKQMTPAESALLKKLIPEGGSILDVGCGTGRLLVPLSEAGYEMSGIDLVPRHVRMVKEQLAVKGLAADVREANWREIPVEDSAFENVIALGRNLLHENAIQGQRAFFREINRVLKKGGRFIFDIPDRERGHYAELVRGYSEAMRKRRIVSRPGTIFDSPDGVHFATRYTYSRADIAALAEGAGFVVVDVKEASLPTGGGDVNLYFVLEKVKEAEELRLPLAA
ncbi:MAG: methyltransferase domain-containing protein, partial [Acidobacteriota bacterium]